MLDDVKGSDQSIRDRAYHNAGVIGQLMYRPPWKAYLETRFFFPPVRVDDETKSVLHFKAQTACIFNSGIRLTKQELEGEIYDKETLERAVEQEIFVIMDEFDRLFTELAQPYLSPPTT